MKTQSHIAVWAFMFLTMWSPSMVELHAKPSCPVIAIRCLSEKSCCGPKYRFAVDITGGYLDQKPTYKWKVSTGKITKGQGTSSITVDANCTGDKPITVIVEIGNVIPGGCPTTASYTTECDKP